ncbi:MAG: carboxypeptidase regulatory-like domain-containing protein [Terracidiphilus sp.]|nr:carboxypeptidase regulatory-like domain-containing protein [Terracidiphilus sp.]
MAAHAQELTATLAGSVTDSTGAVIPGATLVVTKNGVNAAGRTVQSDATGFFIVTNLPAGTYGVKVTAEGFEGYIAKNVVLNVAEKHTLNAQLKAGSVTTTVTVEDNPVAIDTQSSAQAGTISGVQVRELELSSRNFEQLVTLQPGVVNGLGDEASAGGTALAINGARATANNWTVDGADINDSGSNGTVINVPSVDAIQEFTLQRGSYDAGYGRSGGGQILVATKSGTSSFHGTAYEFVRNTALDANEYFNKMTQIANGDKNKNSVNHHNVYGFTIGGPVFIPGKYNTGKTKTFFFWSEEWHKQSTPGSDSMAAATAFNLTGGFTIAHTTDKDGNTVAATLPSSYPANCVSGWTVDSNGDGSGTILSSCYASNSKVYLDNVFSKYPANSGNNYFFAYSQKNNFRDDIVRVDHYFNEKVHFFARGMNDIMPVNYPEGLWAGSNYPGLVNTLVDSPGKNVVGNLTWTISPKVVNEVEFVYSQGTYNSTIAGGQFATSSTVSSALTNNWAYKDPYGRVPAIGITGVTGFSAGSAPWKERNLDRTYFDNLALTLGKHTVRLGFQVQQMLKTENATSGNPSFNFATWGDFLLGNVATYSQVSRDIIPDLHYVNSEAYIQDDWRITKRLIINLGMRWSRFPSPTDVRDTLNNFNPEMYSSLLAPAIDPTSGNFIAGQSVGGIKLLPATYTNGVIFPKGGACSAAQAIAPLVQCSPWGKYINPNRNANFGPRIGFAYSLDNQNKTSIRGGFGIFYDRVLNGIWEQNAFSDPPLAQSSTVNNGSFDAVLGGEAAVSYGPNGLTASGTPAFRVPNYASYNLSVQRQLLPTTMLEVAYVGNVARHLLGDVNINQPTVASRLAINGDLTPYTATTSVNYIRPYQGYAGITSREPVFTNNYNSLQVTLNHRSSKGLTVGIAYTYSKDLTTNSNDRGSMATDTYNLRMDYGPSSTNTPQIFEANYIYDLPFYKTQHGLTGKVLGGWELSGITSLVSGSSFQVTQAYDPWDPTSNNVGLGLGSTRADQVASVQKTKKLTQWFSTSSFSQAVGHFGSEGSNPLIGPGYQSWDLAAIKNLKFAERYSFQLRGEFFNAFNHENFSGVDSSLEDGNFGQVTSGHLPRRIQIGAKFNF